MAADLSGQTQGSAALPLLVGDRLVGALGVTFGRLGRFDADERAFLLTVADQVAVAFERAALADVRREMAETLQRSLLPGDLPVVDRLAVTARYLPAVAGHLGRRRLVRRPAARRRCGRGRRRRRRRATALPPPR